MQPSQADVVIDTWLRLGMTKKCSYSTLNEVTPLEIALECLMNNYSFKPNKIMKVQRELGFNPLDEKHFADDPNFEERMMKTIRMFGTDEQTEYYLTGGEAQ